MKLLRVHDLEVFHHFARVGVQESEEQRHVLPGLHLRRLAPEVEPIIARVVRPRLNELHPADRADARGRRRVRGVHGADPRDLFIGWVCGAGRRFEERRRGDGTRRQRTKQLTAIERGLSDADSRHCPRKRLSSVSHLRRVQCTSLHGARFDCRSSRSGRP